MLIALFAAVALSQAPVAFEVASVKPVAVAAPTMGRSAAKTAIDDARVSIQSATLGELVNLAFRVRPYQVTGPAWLYATGRDAQRFAVEARIPAGAGKERVPEMLQALLAERFKLVSHMEQKEQAVYALVEGKGGFKLKELTADAAETPPKTTNTGEDSIRMEQDLTMAGLCDLATRFLTRAVVDQTGLTGRYRMTIELSIGDMRTIASRNGNPAADGARPMDTANDPTGGTVFQSVQAMGLKLEPKKIVGQQLIVESVEKLPVEN